MTRRFRAAAAMAASLTMLAMTGAPGAAVAAPANPSADGAGLLSIDREDGGALSLRFRDAAGTVRDPGGLRFGPGGGLSTTVPADPAYAFLGTPGRAVWSLSAGGGHFPSIDTTGVRGGGALSLRLTDVDGPGGFAAYTVSRWGRPAVLLDSDGPAEATLTAGTRLPNVAWTFDTAGVHRLTFTVSGAAGTDAGTASAVYTVTVPEITPAAPAPAPPAAAPAAPAPPAPVTPALPAPATPAPPPDGTSPDDSAADSSAPGPAEAGSTPDSSAQARAQAQAQAPAAEAGAAATTVAPASGTVISDGHVDMGPTLENGTWRIRLKDDAATPPVWRELSDVVLKVSDKARIPVPAGTGYAFLGTAGARIHMLPQTQQSGIVWPGWNTQHATVTSGVDGDVTWNLKGVQGPGAFKLFLAGSFGAPQVLFDSAKAMPQKLAIPLNTHAHGNWAFTAPGLYRLSVEMTATTKAGKAVADTRTLTIAVGDATDAGAGFTGGGSDSGGTDTGTDTGTGQSGGRLPLTGGSVLTVVAAGAVLVVLGLAAVVISRRRTVTHDTLPHS
ncbi:putative ABC transporter-associated repeat protein [Catenuloplanes nepalensis]|uniref:ABC transporter-associated repeat protein n=1 Tax=Catenuloplanes nepalensis TaxID=587533 RepID=A0ABT9MMX0_9ACTN|nr:TIGR03773 family transporter-associated surface protein [Catenuloplanes nepalensis]MDP9792676.1 putative ABC transporter-associated repeat protein [Catenuloplanes nepalensis]